MPGDVYLNRMNYICHIFHQRTPTVVYRRKLRPWSRGANVRQSVQKLMVLREMPSYAEELVMRSL